MTDAANVELAIRDETQAVMLTNRQLQVIANTDFVPKSLRGNVPAVLACVARGRAMGIPDMVALNGIVIIEGKATLTAELMEAIVRAHGHSITGKVTANEAILKGKRKDNGDEMEARFDLEMAERAGLLGKANWKKHPDDMMFARAVSKLCRRLFADCFAGGTYVPEEAEATADEIIDTDEREIYEGLQDRSLTGPDGKRDGPDDGATSGPVNDLVDLKARALTAGYTTDDLAAKARELFPEKHSAKELDSVELDQLWNSLAQETLELGGGVPVGG